MTLWDTDLKETWDGGDALYPEHMRAHVFLHTTASGPRDSPPNPCAVPRLRGPCYRQWGEKVLRQESYMARFTFEKILERRQQIKERMGWLNPLGSPTGTAGDHKGKVSTGTKAGPRRSSQLKALTGEQRTSPQGVQ